MSFEPTLLARIAKPTDAPNTPVDKALEPIEEREEIEPPVPVQVGAQ